MNRNNKKIPTRGRNREINETDEECFAINFLMFFLFFGFVFATCFSFHAQSETRYVALQKCLSFNLPRVDGEANKCLAKASVKRTHHNSFWRRKESREESLIFPYAKWFINWDDGGALRCCTMNSRVWKHFKIAAEWLPFVPRQLKRRPTQEHDSVQQKMPRKRTLNY